MNNNDISQSKPEEPNTNMPEQKDIVNSSLEPKKKKEKKKKKKKKKSFLVHRIKQQLFSMINLNKKI